MQYRTVVPPSSLPKPMALPKANRDAETNNPLGRLSSISFMAFVILLFVFNNGAGPEYIVSSEKYAPTASTTESVSSSNSNNLSTDPEDAKAARSLKDERAPRVGGGAANYVTIMEAVAYVTYPMDRETGKLKLPSEVETVIIDIGARRSDYLTSLEESDNNSTAIFLFDPLPDSGLPLAQRAAAYSLRGSGNKWLDPRKKNRVFYTRAAMGDNDEFTEFNVALGPACGSILQVKEGNKFWCADVKGKISTTMLSLASFLPLIPKGVEVEGPHGKGTIKQVHLKIDAEGADLVVLKGAKDMIDMVDTVAIECKADTNEKEMRENECVASEAVKYMVEERKFKLYKVQDQGGLVNIFWVNPKYEGPIPELLLSSKLHFAKQFYRNIDENWIKENLRT